MKATFTRVVLGLLLAVGPLAVMAEPTVGELIATCEQALAQDYAGLEATMCDWYVAPCGVCGREGPPAKEWCVPQDMTPATVAGLVVKELRGIEAARPGKSAAKEILRRRFPCAVED